MEARMRSGICEKMIFIARVGTTRVLTSRRAFPPPTQVLAQDIDLLNPPAELEASKHKLKRLVQAPNSFFMDVKCQVSLVFFLFVRAQLALFRDVASTTPRTPRLTDRPRSSRFIHPQGCFNITTVFSHSQTVVLCGSCSAVLCQPTGGKARLTEGCSFRRKGD